MRVWWVGCGWGGGGKDGVGGCTRHQPMAHQNYAISRDLALMTER